MAEIWILRGKYEIFSLKTESDELQELELGHFGKLIFMIFPQFFKNRLECPFGSLIWLC